MPLDGFSTFASDGGDKGRFYLSKIFLDKRDKYIYDDGNLVTSGESAAIQYARINAKRSLALNELIRMGVKLSREKLGKVFSFLFDGINDGTFYPEDQPNIFDTDDESNIFLNFCNALSDDGKPSGVILAFPSSIRDEYTVGQLPDDSIGDDLYIHAPNGLPLTEAIQIKPLGARETQALENSFEGIVYPDVLKLLIEA